MQALANLSELVVAQRKDWGEILVDLEQGNRYRVFGPDGQEMLRAGETGGSWLARMFLRSWRPFEMSLVTPEGKQVLHLQRPFKFYFTEIHVADANGRKLGHVQRRFSILRRQYAVFDAGGREVFQLYAPLLHPWTFEVRQSDRALGKIAKRWSGLLCEGFTDADTFGVAFPSGADAGMKAVLLGATFLIDFAHFESSK